MSFFRTEMFNGISLPKHQELWKFWVFIGFIILCFFPFVSPPIALGLGVIISAIKIVPAGFNTSRIATHLLKISIVLMGFGINISQAIQTSKSGFVISAVFIGITISLGLLLGYVLKIDKIISTLITIGTAICGGSAIAAVSPILGAKERQLSFGLGVVFLLNAVALILFPLLGTWFDLSQTQFGYWAAIAIHDTSSVVGASAAYGEEALRIATTVKLIRALWIIPVSIAVALIFGSKKVNKVRIPWFIALFIVAMSVSYFVPSGGNIFGVLDGLGKKGMVITLFLIGTGLPLSEVKEIGIKPFILGVILWIIVSVLSLITVIELF